MTERSPRRMSSDARRAQLVSAAVDELASGGSAALALEAVAARAGVTRNLLYHYFPGGVAELYAAAVEQAGRELTEGWTTDPAVPAAERVAQNFARIVDHAAAPSRAWRVHRMARGSTDPRVLETRATYQRRIVDAMAANNLGTTDPPPLARAALEAYLAFGESLLDAMRERGLPREEVVGVMARLLAETARAAG